MAKSLEYFIIFFFFSKRYKHDRSSDVKNDKIFVKSSENHYIMEDLRPAVYYQFWVAANSLLGQGNASTIIGHRIAKNNNAGSKDTNGKQNRGHDEAIVLTLIVVVYLFLQSGSTRLAPKSPWSRVIRSCYHVATPFFQSATSKLTGFATRT